jgi:DNA-binding transcriptional LysR family regulator
MNVHFLELFYHVARHGGISAAVRQMPYGIQQPAVSTQVGKLERDLGVKLFERTPFRLTQAGEELYAFVQPFFDALPKVEDRLKSAKHTELRIGGAELILRDHLPLALRSVKNEFPKLKISLRALGFQAEAEAWLQKGQLDIAFLPLHRRPPAKLKQLPMATLPLVLQVPARSSHQTVAELFSQKRISLPLICLPETSGISQAFQNELKRRGIHWPQTIEAGSLDLVYRYVANGDGIGVNVGINGDKKTRDVRSLPLDKFPGVTVGAVWCGELSPAAKATIDRVHAYAKRTWPGSVA